MPPDSRGLPLTAGRLCRRGAQPEGVCVSVGNQAVPEPGRKNEQGWGDESRIAWTALNSGRGAAVPLLRWLITIWLPRFPLPPLPLVLSGSCCLCTMLGCSGP